MVIKAVYTDLAGTYASDGLRMALDMHADEAPRGFTRQFSTFWPLLTTGMIDEDIFWKEVLGRGYDPEKAGNLRACILDNHTPYREMEDLFRELREGDLRTGIITNTARGWFEYWDKKFGLRDGFDYIVTSYEAVARKEGPAIFSHALSLSGTQPGETVYLDDQERMLKPARDMGIRVVHAQSPEQAVRDFRRVLNE